MNLLDENIIASQRELLRSWRVSIRQIGFDLVQKGLKDEEIISLLHTHRRSTFFTRALGFYNRSLCHARYCLACLAVSKDEVAVYIRRLLRHVDFKSQPQRLGLVMHVSQGGIRRWSLNSEQEKLVTWLD